MKPMISRQWMAVALMLFAGGLLVSCGGGGEEGTEGQQGGPPPVIQDGATMTVDAVSGGAVDASRIVDGAAPFDADVVITKAVSGYQGYQYFVQWDPAVLAYDGQKDLKPEGLELCAEPVLDTDRVYGGCARTSENTNYTGPTNTLTFHCVADGVSPLHLVTLTEDPNFGATNLGYAGQTIETELVDASVTCQGTGQAPAVAPTPTTSP
jgi:hypothetical protein